MALKFSRSIHPGGILREEFLVPLDMSPGALARKLGLPRTRIERIVTERVGITTDTALRLAKFFDTTPEFWINMQTAYEIETESRAIAAELDKIETRQLEAA